MDTVTILRDLWRARTVVLCVWLLALLAGTAVLYKISWPPALETRRYEVGIATTSLLIDTPSSQVVEIAPKGSDTLGVRANLIASLMVDGTVKASIARLAGVPADDLVGISTSAQDSGSPPAPRDRYTPVLTTRVVTDNDGSELPIIQIEAQATDAAAAAKLAGAAVDGLREYLDSTAAVQQVPNAKRLQVTGLGQTEARTDSRGPKGFFAAVAALFVFGLGCAAILAIRALIGAWRIAADTDPRSGEGVFGGLRRDASLASARSNGSAPLVRKPEVSADDDQRDESWVSPPRHTSLKTARKLRLQPPPGTDEPEVRSA